MNIAIIPARKGSKRILEKNIKIFFNFPVIQYSIRAAIDSGLFDKVIVSTDSNKISKIARKYGAEVPFLRPKKISDDHSTTIEVISHALDFLKKNDSEYYSQIQNVCCIYPAAPLIKIKYLKDSYKIIKKKKWDYVFPVVKFENLVQRAIYKKNNKIKMLFNNFYNKRTQDIKETFYDAGQFYWGKKDSWKKKKKIFSSKSNFIVLPAEQVQDIDDLSDWNKAKKKFILLNNR
jgi:N-acylneuraminate cytidylyltransferase